MSKAILNDLTLCIGCGACTLACQEINDLPKQERPSELSAGAWTAIERRKGVNIRRQCMHCLEPTCVSVCPVSALQKTPEGPVIYDAGRCIGCRYCVFACPFGVPKYEWDEQLPIVQKCIMCYENRVKKGEAPACVSVCPTGATIFGERDDLIKEARRRIDENPGRYVDHIYGLEEAGGTGVLYLSAVPFEELGFKAHLHDEAYPELTWAALSKIPNVLSVGGVLLAGVYWTINRRMTIEQLRHESPAEIGKDHDYDGGES